MLLLWDRGKLSDEGESGYDEIKEKVERKDSGDEIFLYV